MSLTLTYFDIRARAEPMRMYLVDAGVEFIDERVRDYQGWKEAKDGKKAQPFEVLPILKVVDEKDGKVFNLPETIAIMQYLEEKYCVIPGYKERAALERAKMTAVLNASLWFVDQHWDFFWAENFVDADAMGRREARSDEWLTRMETFLEPIPEEMLFTAPVEGKGTTLTAAAVWLLEAFDMVENLFPESVMLKHPRLATMHKSMVNRPRIAAYIESGKVTKQITLSAIETEERKAAGRAAWLAARHGQRQ